MPTSVKLKGAVVLLNPDREVAFIMSLSRLLSLTAKSRGK